MSSLKNLKNVIVTGGCGFIGGYLVRRLIEEGNYNIVNIDKLSYASDHSITNEKIKISKDSRKRYKFIKSDLCNFEELNNIVSEFKPEIIFHLAAESHVDRSIDEPLQTIQSNIIGTFNLLESTRKFLKLLPNSERDIFKFIHISTDEVFGSLNSEGLFDEKTRYDPRSPYAASKASSDHLVRAWGNTYGITTMITNCSNNFGPAQFPEKLIPTIILKSLKNESIPIYGNGRNIRDWLFVEDHIDALILVAEKGKPNKTYCIGGNNAIENRDLAEFICQILDQIKPKGESYQKQIVFVEDRPGHDLRYAINPELVSRELGWSPKNNFNDNLKKTINWYVNNQSWCELVMKNSSFDGARLGIEK
tara:strand:+ start:1386 stop:2474 length:1089 start_codon:yes stop_codon:yes gene_type:complete